MPTARSRNSRRSCIARSYPSVIDDLAKVQRSPDNRIPEREISNTDLQRLSESEKELHWQTLLGKKVLCQYSWIIGKTDSGLYSESGARREAARADILVRSLTIRPSGWFSSSHPLCGWYMIWL